MNKIQSTRRMLQDKTYSQSNCILSMAKTIGNQAMIQRQGDPDGEWQPGPEDLAQEKRDQKEDLIRHQQYLSSKTLRENLGNPNGGEAHHIIPSCIAEQLHYDSNECNKAWNGILLQGSPGKYPFFFSQTAIMPFHRKRQYNHPKYNDNVAKVLGHSGIEDAKVLARHLYSVIFQMQPHEFIDDISYDTMLPK